MVVLRAVVHIGPMKTGATAFAVACSQAESNGTMPPGLVHPSGSLWFDTDRTVVKHHELRALAREPGDIRRKRKRRRFRTASVSEARARSAVERLRHADTADEMQVARRQTRAIASIISRGVNDISASRRRRLTAARHLSGSRRLDRFDDARVLDNWRTDAVTLHVIPFDGMAAGTTTRTEGVFDRLDLERAPYSPSPATPRAHPAFSAAGQKPHRQKLDSDLTSWRQTPWDEERVRTAYVDSNSRFVEQLGREAAGERRPESCTTVGIAVAPGPSSGRPA